MIREARAASVPEGKRDKTVCGEERVRRSECSLVGCVDAHSPFAKAASGLESLTHS